MFSNDLPFTVEQSEILFQRSETLSNYSKDVSVLHDGFPISKGMKSAQLNIRSLRNKKVELSLFLESNPYDILTSTETWLDNDYPLGLLSHDEYYFERRDRPDQPDRGI